MATATATSPGAEIGALVTKVEEFHLLSELLHTMQINAEELSGIRSRATGLVEKCIELLRIWRHRQNYAALRGDPDDAENLNRLQDLFSLTLESLQAYRGGLAELCQNGAPPEYNECLVKINELQKRLKSRSWVIEENPSQMYFLESKKDKSEKGKKAVKGKRRKTNEDDEDDSGEECADAKAERKKKISVTIRCLIPELWPQASVKMDFIIRHLEKTSAQCPAVFSERRVVEGTSNSQRYKWNRVVLMSYLEAPGLRCGAKKGAKLYVIRCVLENQIVAETLPFGFYKQTKQVPDLSGYILWFNAFAVAADPCLTTQVIPNCVELSEVLEVLNCEYNGSDGVVASYMKSRGTNQLDREAHIQPRLNALNMRCLADMLNVRDPKDSVHQRVFLEEKTNTAPSADKFSFWEWFYACCKLVRERLPNVYKHGLLYGFITKKDTNDLLERYYITPPPGRMLMVLRFSTQHIDKTLACITPSVMWTWTDPEDKRHGNPFSSDRFDGEEKKLGTLLIQEIGQVGDHADLKIIDADDRVLYFDQAFGQFMCAMDKTGYVDLREVRPKVPSRPPTAAPTVPSGAANSPVPSVDSCMNQNTAPSDVAGEVEIDNRLPDMSELFNRS